MRRQASFWQSAGQSCLNFGMVIVVKLNNFHLRCPILYDQQLALDDSLRVSTVQAPLLGRVFYTLAHKVSVGRGAYGTLVRAMCDGDDAPGSYEITHPAPSGEPITSGILTATCDVLPAFSRTAASSANGADHIDTADLGPAKCHPTTEVGASAFDSPTARSVFTSAVDRSQPPLFESQLSEAGDETSHSISSTGSGSRAVTARGDRMSVPWPKLPRPSRTLREDGDYLSQLPVPTRDTHYFDQGTDRRSIKSKKPLKSRNVDDKGKENIPIAATHRRRTGTRAGNHSPADTPSTTVRRGPLRI
ncbi:hypothetical protein H4Q26_012039 [Puccinia striiformis f. sp. tritici PST-130]|nr:hypothetical protein H4Q26_012039 [Puccinia striiformis f. sp. tritici PST-130]